MARLARIYVSLAVIVLNVMVALVFLNAVVATAYRVAPLFRTHNPITEKYGEDAVRRVYPGWKDTAVRDLLKETWSRPYIFEPFTQFRERPFSGQYVNVSEHGYRVTKNQGPWPPAPDNLNIFMFGGSTTFGYGVADKETIASNLQDILDARGWRHARVYNFGCGSYFSTQERLLFERLLTNGLVPQIAIFVDGLNDFYYYDAPNFSEELAGVVSGEKAKSWRKTWSGFALGRAVSSLSARLEHQPVALTETEAAGNRRSRSGGSELVQNVILRYLGNKRLIEVVASAYGAKPVFIWQPVPTYQYDEHYHPFKGRDYGRHALSHVGYRAMKERLAAKSVGGNFFWLADMQKDLREPLYIDQVHYSPRFSHLIAEQIADVVVERIAVGHPPHVKFAAVQGDDTDSGVRVAQ